MMLDLLRSGVQHMKELMRCQNMLIMGHEITSCSHGWVSSPWLRRWRLSSTKWFWLTRKNESGSWTSLRLAVCELKKNKWLSHGQSGCNFWLSVTTFGCTFTKGDRVFNTDLWLSAGQLHPYFWLSGDFVVVPGERAACISFGRRWVFLAWAMEDSISVSCQWLCISCTRRLFL